MPLSNSVLRRYTPPTCTLEISAKDSPLSRWAGQPVMKHLRFQLSLDDPRQPEEKWLTLRGNRAQLEALHQAVETYIQTFLEHSTIDQTRLSSAFGADGLRAGYPSLVNSGVSMPTEFSSDHQASELPVAETQSAIGSVAPHAAAADAVQPYQAGDAGIEAIHLQPRGLLAHDLFLGPLATDASGAVIRLSTLQLFDLATALDEYAAEVLALPNLQRSAWLKSPTGWGQIAALSLLTVGLATSAVKLLDGSYSSQQSAPMTSQGATSEDQQRVAIQVSPSPSPGVPAPLTTPQPLPPPPPTGSTVPSNPGFPTVNIPRTPTTNPGGGSAASEPAAGSSTSRIALSDRPQPTAKRSGNQTANNTPAQDLPILAPIERSPAQFEGAPAPSNARSAGSADQQDAAASNPADSNSTAFDTIPQVAEVRRYFQSRWKPPAGLTQTLEYSLQLGSDGSLQRITPLGQSAGDYIDRTGIPLLGEPFVSPLQSDRTPPIRLVLGPDGNVQTFLER